MVDVTIVLIKNNLIYLYNILMFSVSHKSKSIFWHIHKNGGSYVEFILKEYYDFNGYNDINKNLIDNLYNIQHKLENNINSDLDAKDKLTKCGCIENIKEYGLLGYIIKQNNKIFDIEKYNFDKYTIFAFIRDPYDRAISSYEFLMNKKFDNRIDNSIEKLSFLDFYKNYEKYSNNIFLYTHAFMTQYENIKNKYNNMQVNYLCDYNNINADLINILKTNEITNPYEHVELIKNNFKINSSKKKKITEYYCDESLKIINDLFKDDFINFNFKIYNNIDELNVFLEEYNDNTTYINKNEKIYNEYKINNNSSDQQNEISNSLNYKSKYK
jgi:hypothetical protein